MTLFRFKQFSIRHSRSTLKIGTDAVLLGALAPIEHGCRRIIDVGTGCGIIALMLAQRSKAHIEAIDIDRDSVDEAYENFAQSPWPEQLSAKHSSVQDYSQNHPGSFDLAVSNPPFFCNSQLPVNPLRRLAKHTSNAGLSAFLAASAKLISPQGKLAVIMPVATVTDFEKFALNLGLYPEIVFEIIPVKGKPANRKIIILSGKRVKQATHQIITLRNLSGEFTDQYKSLTGDFHPEGYLL